MFELETDEEIEEIVEDILDLCGDMGEYSAEELKKSHSEYGRKYKKILHNLEEYYNQDILGSGAPQFLVELIQEIETPGIFLSSTTIKRVQMGLRKIARKLEIDLPKVNKPKENLSDPTLPQTTNIYMSQSQNQFQQQSMNVENLVVDLEAELKKSHPDKSKIKSSMKKILEHGAQYLPKATELILKYWPFD